MKTTKKKLTKVERRLAIVKDAIKQLQIGMYKTGNYGYVHLSKEIERMIDKNDSAQELLCNTNKPCGVCAKGSLFLSIVRKENELDSNDLNAGHSGLIHRLVQDGLFTEENLALVEAYYEASGSGGGGCAVATSTSTSRLAPRLTSRTQKQLRIAVISFWIFGMNTCLNKVMDEFELNARMKKREEEYFRLHDPKYSVLRRLPKVDASEIDRFDASTKAFVIMLKETENPYQVLDEALMYYFKVCKDQREMIEKLSLYAKPEPTIWKQ